MPKVHGCTLATLAAVTAYSWLAKGDPPTDAAGKLVPAEISPLAIGVANDGRELFEPVTGGDLRLP